MAHPSDGRTPEHRVSQRQTRTTLERAAAQSASRLPQQGPQCTVPRSAPAQRQEHRTGCLVRVEANTEGCATRSNTTPSYHLPDAPHSTPGVFIRSPEQTLIKGQYLYKPPGQHSCPSAHWPSPSAVASNEAPRGGCRYPPLHDSRQQGLPWSSIVRLVLATRPKHYPRGRLCSALLEERCCAPFTAPARPSPWSRQGSGWQPHVT